MKKQMPSKQNSISSNKYSSNNRITSYNKLHSIRSNNKGTFPTNTTSTIINKADDSTKRFNKKEELSSRINLLNNLGGNSTTKYDTMYNKENNNNNNNNPNNTTKNFGFKTNSIETTKYTDFNKTKKIGGSGFGAGLLGNIVNTNYTNITNNSNINNLNQAEEEEEEDREREYRERLREEHLKEERLKEEQKREIKNTHNEIMDIIRLRNEIKEDYIKITPKSFQTYKYNIINKWKEVINKLLPINIKLALLSMKVMGDIYIEFDDYERAKFIYFYYKIIVYNLGFLEELMIAYESLGTVYKFLYQYQKAILCYKKQIELSWILNNRDFELRGYDNIGIQYYYLGNRDRAKYYHIRMVCGRYEKNKSDIKEKVTKNFKEKHFNFFQTNGRLKIEIADKTEVTKMLLDILSMFNINKDSKEYNSYNHYNNKYNSNNNLLNEDMVRDIELTEVPDSVKNSYISQNDVTFNIISK